MLSIRIFMLKNVCSLSFFTKSLKCFFSFFSSPKIFLSYAVITNFHTAIFFFLFVTCVKIRRVFFSPQRFFSKAMKYLFYLSLPNFPKTQDIIFLQRIKTEKCFDLEKMDEPKMNFTASGFQTRVCFVLKKKAWRV